MEVEAVKRMCYHIIVIKHKELSGGRYQPVYMPLFYEQHRKKYLYIVKYLKYSAFSINEPQTFCDKFTKTLQWNVLVLTCVLHWSTI